MLTGLRKLKYGDDFKQSLEAVALPIGLRSLTFGAEFNQSLDAVALPSNLRKLTFGDHFNKGLEAAAGRRGFNFFQHCAPFARPKRILQRFESSSGAQRFHPLSALREIARQNWILQRFESRGGPQRFRPLSGLRAICAPEGSFTKVWPKTVHQNCLTIGLAICTIFPNMNFCLELFVRYCIRIQDGRDEGY